MSEEQKAEYNDGLNDSFAAVAIIAIVVAAVVFWLHGLPT